MKKLSLIPDQENYSIQDGVTAIYAKLEGGAGRLRKDYLHAPAIVTMQWTCDEVEFDYLRTFYRTTSEGTEPFLMDLILHGSDFTEHECRIVPKTFKTSSVKAKTYRVQAQLEVLPLPPDDALDEGLVTSFEAFGVEASLAYQLLAVILNVDMPANLK